MEQKGFFFGLAALLQALAVCDGAGAFITCHRRHYDAPVMTRSRRVTTSLFLSDKASSVTSSSERYEWEELKEQQKLDGLKVSGRKDELVERLLNSDSLHDGTDALLEEHNDETEELVPNKAVTFESLGLSKEVISAVRSQPEWAEPTPIQRLAIPRLLDSSSDAFWCEAPTGSGKTAAYSLPLLEKLRHPKGRGGGRIASLVLVPTRELAVQIASVVSNLANNVGGRKRWNISVIHGGVQLEPQLAEMASAVRDDRTIDVLIATPGRLHDVLTYYDESEEEAAKAAALERRLLDALDSKSKADASLSLTQLEELKLDDLVDDGRSSMKELLQGLDYLVLDEADRLLGGAFQADLDNLLALLPPHKLQLWMFSATFSKQIEPRADYVLKRVGGSDASPVRISCFASDRVTEDQNNVSGRLQKKLQRVGPHRTLEQVGPASTIQLRTIRLDQPHRTQALRRLLEENEEEWDRVLVFVSTRYASQHVARKLRRVGIDSAELHGKLDQKARLKRLSDFRKGKVRVLLATDVASRGLDVVGLPAVINYDLPRSTADFVHRVGRTGRAGRVGTAVSFVTPSNEAQLDLIEKRHLVEPVERHVLSGLEPNEEEWKVKSEAARISAPGAVPSRLGLAHDRMHGGIKGRRKSKKDRLREKASRDATAEATKQPEA